MEDLDAGAHLRLGKLVVFGLQHLVEPLVDVGLDVDGELGLDRRHPRAEQDGGEHLGEHEWEPVAGFLALPLEEIDDAPHGIDVPHLAVLDEVLEPLHHLRSHAPQPNRPHPVLGELRPVCAHNSPKTGGGGVVV